MTGKPVFGVEERPVPQSDVPGETDVADAAVPDQAARRSRASTPLTRADLSTMTRPRGPSARRMFDQTAKSGGIFTPQGYHRLATLWFPGTLGGATWSGGIDEPRLGYLSSS